MPESPAAQLDAATSVPLRNHACWRPFLSWPAASPKPGAHERSHRRNGLMPITWDRVADAAYVYLTAAEVPPRPPNHPVRKPIWNRHRTLRTDGLEGRQAGFPGNALLLVEECLGERTPILN